MAWVFANWYEKNKDKHNAKRRKRYKTDTSYQKKVKDWNATARDNKRVAEVEVDTVAPDSTTQRVDHGPFRSFVIDGTVYFTIGALAAVLNCTCQAIRGWEKAGKIPQPSRITGKYVRLYTAELIQQIVQERQTDGGTLLSDVYEPAVSVLWRKVRFVGSKTAEMVALFRLGVVVRVVGRAVYTLISLENEGILPRTPLTIPLQDGSNGYVRLYTAEMVEGLVKAFTRYSDLTHPVIAEKFTAFVTAQWKELHIFSKTYTGTTAELV